MKYLLILFTFLINFNSDQNNNLTGAQLLEKSIQYHDPKGNWSAKNWQLNLEQESPNRAPRITTCHFYSNGGFKQEDSRGNNRVIRTLSNDKCQHELNGKKGDFTEEEIKKHRLTCEGTKFWRDYQVYLYGLPMKLKDTGTIVHEKVEKVIFFEQDALKLKVTYNKEVGKDTWYFYFNPKSYALISYQFFHEEDKNDGEYILLNGEVKANGVRLPKERKWYYNKDDKFLGTDIINKLSSMK